MFNGKKFSNLDVAVQTKIRRGELRFIVLQNDSDPNIQFDIFMRLNTGAVALNQQELRNCLYRGTLNDMVKEFVLNNECAKVMIRKNPTRMFGNELVLRYLAISNSFDKKTQEIKNYDGRLKNIINCYMKSNQNVVGEELLAIKTKIQTSFEKAFRVYGEKAFLTNDFSTKINASLAECILIAFEDYDISVLEDKKNELNKGRLELLSDPDFIKYIDKATGNTESINKRVKKFSDMVKSRVENDF